MMLLYSKIIGTPVAELRDATKIGLISDLIIEESDLSVAAAVVETNLNPFSKKQVVAATDFVKIFKDGIVVNDADAIVELDEVVRAAKLYDNNCHGLVQRVVTKSGVYVGHVYDYLFDAETTTIHKLYVKKLFSEQIIPTTIVTSMSGKIITIDDNKLPNFVPNIGPAIE